MSWSSEKAHADLRAWWPAAGFDAAGAPYAFATIDVHQNWFRLVIRAWNRLSQSRLLYADTITNGPSRCAEIADTLGILRARTVIDGNYNTQVVRRWAAQFGWRVFRGEAHEKDYPHPDKVRRIFSEPSIIDPFQGTAHQGQARITEYKFAKWSALERFMLLRTLKANDGTALFTAADDAPAWYFEEIDDYASIPKFIKGIETREWQSKSNDHSADCEIMGVVAAAATGCTGAESLATDHGQLTTDHGQLTTDHGPRTTDPPK